MTITLLILPSMSYNEKLWQHQIDNLNDSVDCKVVIPNSARLQAGIDKVLNSINA